MDMRFEQQVEVAKSDERRPYETPTVTLLDEAELLKVFQITSAGVSWWA